MSLDFALPLKLLKQPLHDSIDELRHGYQALSECVEQAVAECEQRGAELADCRRQLAEARRSLMELEKAIAERQLAEHDAARHSKELKQGMEATQAELALANERLLRAQADEMRLEVQTEHNQQLQAQIERLQSEETQSREELARLRGQLGPLTEAAVEAAQLRAELAAAQAELTTLGEQLAARSGQPELGEQLATALAERQEAESELDQLRRRAAELAEALTEQKRINSEQREQWSEELRLLRKAVDRQSELLVHRPAAVQAAAPAATHEGHSAAPSKNDRVMEAVVQQFEMLQKNKVRKLAKSAG